MLDWCPMFNFDSHDLRLPRLVGLLLMVIVLAFSGCNTGGNGADASSTSSAASSSEPSTDIGY